MTDGQNGGGPRWVWVAKTALAALGVLILIMLNDLRTGQDRISAQAAEAVRQASAARDEVAVVSGHVSRQADSLDDIIAKLRFYRSDDDKEWKELQRRVLMLEIEDNRRHDRGEDWRR